MELRLILMALFCLCFVQVAFAIEDSYAFVDDSQRIVFTRLTQQTRCVVCQNQSLFESSASLADDLKAFIYARLLSGDDEQQIKMQLRQGYGDSIFFEPPMKFATWMLWLGPWMVMLIGLLLYNIWINRLV